MRSGPGKVYFYISAAFLLCSLFFSVGFVVAKFKLPPYGIIQTVYVHVRSFQKYGVAAPEKLIYPIPSDASADRLSVIAPASMQHGYYAFLGYNGKDGIYRAELFDHTGKRHQVWNIRYGNLDPDAVEADETPHGFSVLKDGSIIVNFDKGNVLARLDACSKPVWTKKGVYHHSLQRDNDGNFWTWRGEGSAYSQYQHLVNFDPATGDTVREISLVDDFIRPAGNKAAPFVVTPEFPFEHFDKDPGDAKDIFHPNDIDVLSHELAPLFPGFEAGDLLISLKKLNMVAVLDPDRLAVKWAAYGPWRWQHDPDFTTGGTISVYNNNPGSGRSDILSIDPRTRHVSNVLEDSDFRFYSATMGKHQYLPNGNILLVVPEEGRILVLSDDGRKILEFNNHLNEQRKFNAIVENAVWLPADYFDTVPTCNQN